MQADPLPHFLPLKKNLPPYLNGVLVIAGTRDEVAGEMA